MDLFSGISEAELSSMLYCLNPRQFSYEKNDCPARAGELFTSLGIVLSGELSVVKERIDGSRMVLTQIRPGQMFGEMVAFSATKIWPNTVCATEKSEILFLSPEKITTTCGNACIGHRSLVNNLLGILSDKALHLNKLVEYISYKTLRGKISALLLEQYRQTGNKTFTLSFDRNHLAEYLNVSRPSLSRELSRMKEEGLLDYHKSSFKLLNLEKLESYLE